MKQLDPKAVWLFFIQQSYAVIFMGFLTMILGTTLIRIGITGAGKKVNTADLLTYPSILILCFLAVLILSYFWARLSYHYYRYELTDIGFKKEHGIIYKKYVTIPYEKIQNVDIHRPLLARLLGLSDLQIQTAGMSYSPSAYGAVSEGRLPGLSVADAEQMRDELVRRSQATNKTPTQPQTINAP